MEIYETILLQLSLNIIELLRVISCKSFAGFN